MTYSKPMGMMYATAGLGMGPSGISPPFRKYGFRAFDGLGDKASQEGKGGTTSTTVGVRALQTLLLSKGFDTGPVDGVWGSRTRSALTTAAQAAGKALGSVGVAAGSVQLASSVWTAIKGLPSNPVSPTSAPSSSSSSSSSASPSDDIVPLPEMEPSRAPVSSWLPWVLGAGVLAGVGGYFLYRGKGKAKGKAKRRTRKKRRRTSRSR